MGKAKDSPIPGFWGVLENPNGALWVLIFSQLITGSTYLVAKLGLREFSPFSLGCLRFLLAGAIYFGILKMRRQPHFPRKEDYGAFFWLALLSVPLNQGFFLYGIKETLAAHGALLYATTPMQVFVLSVFFLGERPTPMKIFGIALGFVGVFIVLAEKGISFSSQTFRGDVIIFFAVLIWSIFTILSKRQLPKYPALNLTGYALCWGAILFLPLGIPSILSQDFSKVTWIGVSSVLFLAILTSVVAYFIWVWALSYLDAGKCAIVANLQPIITAFLGWAILGEILTKWFFLGAILVVAGVYFTQKG